MTNVEFLILTVSSFYRVEQLPTVVSNAVLEHDLDILDVLDVTSRIAFHDDEISILASLNGADSRLAAEIFSTVQAGDSNRLHWRESRFDKQLELALICESWNEAGDTHGIGPRDKKSACRDEGTFEIHLLAQ